MVLINMNEFCRKKILILPFPALGDLTIYIRLARNFYNNGADVTIRSDVLKAAADFFPWLTIEASVSKEELEQLGIAFDLVFANYEMFYSEALEAVNGNNIAYVTAKKIPKKSPVRGKSVFFRGREYKEATRAFCADSKQPLTMVQWVDEYCVSVFDIQVPVIAPEILLDDKDERRILVFPVSPHEKKNYWLSGFKRIANRLIKNGWDVKFVCAPNELDMLKPKLKNYELVTFSNVGDLLKYIASSKLVISNDSGGGHFASMCGLETYTLTRRDASFAWRPGYSKNNVISPWFRFKFLRKYVWRPFIPYWQVAEKIGRYEKNVKK